MRNVHGPCRIFQLYEKHDSIDQLIFSRCYLCSTFFRPMDGETRFILSSLTFLHKSSKLLPTSPIPLRFFRLSLKNAKSDVTSLQLRIIMMMSGSCFSIGGKAISIFMFLFHARQHAEHKSTINYTMILVAKTGTVTFHTTRSPLRSFH